jgi:hypothetical protein
VTPVPEICVLYPSLQEPFFTMEPKGIKGI